MSTESLRTTSQKLDDSATRFAASRSMQRRVHEIIPGGAHTYAKGDDQFPVLAPGFITRGKGCHVWDVDGNRYVEYGMGCRAVTLGHAFKPVNLAVARSLARGTNFTRPCELELECAEELLSMIPAGEMCKFSKDGSTVTTAAFKLARAATGRDMIALCGDHPFFSIHDWFIGTTDIHGGIPDSIRELSTTFRYNDPESLRRCFAEHPGRIAAVILEPAKYSDPEDHFLHRVQEICRENEAVFILDEMITGFRWHNGGAQAYYDIEPDLSTFGKGFANGFSLSALVGRADLMQACGLYHDRERVFALSTTHGAESTGLAAAIATMKFYQENPVIEKLRFIGQQLIDRLPPVIDRHGLTGVVKIIGKPCNLVFAANDPDGKPSQAYRSLLMQELIRHGVLGPSLVVSYSHDESDVEQTVAAFDAACEVYVKAMSDGPEPYLVGPPTQVVYRSHNDNAFRGPRMAFDHQDDADSWAAAD